MGTKENINSVTNAKAIKTTSFLVGKYYDFLNLFNLNALNYKIDMAVVKDVGRRYAYDVDRLHRYHDTDFIDRHKIAGYLTYWICKLRPISVDDHGIYFESAKRPLYINELFALYVGMGRINAHHEYHKTMERATISKSLTNTFLYDLRYRPTTGDMLSMSYYLIEKSSKK
jgi:hypothetical protein